MYIYVAFGLWPTNKQTETFDRLGLYIRTLCPNYFEFETVVFFLGNPIFLSCFPCRIE